MDYAVLDIETSGGDYNEESIIEIAVYRFDGKRVTDTFISLINPEKKIHTFIQKLTGISQNMVKTAPKFYEIAKRLLEITDNAIVVAHNAEFDYRVLQLEYSRLGFDFQRQTLDTLALSRTLLPDLPSYSLGKLCDNLGIPLTSRHRAFGDAQATVKLLELLLSKDSKKDIVTSYIKSLRYNSFNSKIIQLLESLPTQLGIFYLHNKSGDIIYIGKANSLVQRTHNILTDKKNKKLQEQTENISYELTGSKIIAEIKYKNEIKINKPKYKLLKESEYKYGILKRFSDGKKNKVIFVTDEITKENKKDVILMFSSLQKARSFIIILYTYLKNNNLTGKTFLPSILPKKKTFLLIDQGRKIGEKSFLLIKNGVLKGYGYYTLHSQIKDIDRISKIMIPTTGNALVYSMIKEKIILNQYIELQYI